MQAAVECYKKGIPCDPEIMIPIVYEPNELAVLRQRTERIVADYLSKNQLKFEVKIGTMIEVPRAAILADEIAQYADFFSAQ